MATVVAAGTTTAGAAAVTSSAPPDGLFGQAYSHTFSTDLTDAVWSVTSGALPSSIGLAPATGELTGAPTDVGTSGPSPSPTPSTRSRPATTGIQYQPEQTTSTIICHHPGPRTSWPAEPTTGDGEPTTTCTGQVQAHGNAPSRRMPTDGARHHGAGGDDMADAAVAPAGPRPHGAHPRVAATALATVALLLVVLTPSTTAHAATDAITSPLPPTGRAGLPYSHQFTADPSAHRWGVASGTLPAGLMLDAATGALTGTPTTGASPNVTVRARWLRHATTVAAGLFHTCALLDSGAVTCWGAGADGRLGLGDTEYLGDEPGELGDDLPAIDLGTSRHAVEITAGGDHTCALLDDATVKCWGYNGRGQLGLGHRKPRGGQPDEMGDDLPPVDFGTGRTAVTIDAGVSHTCALLDDGTIKCWGSNTYGQLGLGDTAARGDQWAEMGNHLPAVDLGAGRSAVAVSAGGGFSCALLDDDTTKCWGANYAGKLGQGDDERRGDEPGEMGDDLPPVDLGTGRTTTAIAAGSSLLDDATVKCWGYNGEGQLGQGDTSDRGDQPGEMGDDLLPVDLGTGRTASAITIGDAHVCALLDDATTTCWGSGSLGRLGRGDTSHRGDQPAELGDDLSPVDVGADRAATSITAGYAHTCALLDDATTTCWGDNAVGQLGQGDTARRGDQPDELGDTLPPVDLGTAISDDQSFPLIIDGVSSMAPRVGLTSGGTEVTLTGVGFSDVTGVRFGSTPAAGFSVVDDTTITAVSPARPAGLVNVWLDAPSGSSSNLAVSNFGYQDPPVTAPTITSVSPNIGDVAGGQQVTIVGSGFLSATSVAFGPTPATSYTILSDARIVATTPARPESLVNVRVTNPNGTNPNQPTSWYSYRTITGPPPTVSAVSPTSGPATGGQTITITGTGFTGTIRVDLGPTTAPAFTVIDDTTIEITTPARPPGLVNVFVRTNNGTNPTGPSSWYRST